jgi:uncharacterized Zn-finger protein
MRSFSYRHNMLRHKREAHGNKTENRSFHCFKCGKVFSTTSNLNKHIKFKTCEKQFSCAHCYSQFTRRDNLKRHLESNHKGLQARRRMIKCPFCEERFRDLDFMDRHIESQHPQCSHPPQSTSISGPQPSSSSNSTVSSDEQPSQESGIPEMVEALNGDVVRYRYHPSSDRFREYHVREYLMRMQNDMTKRLQEQLRKHRAVKWYIAIHINFSRPHDRDTDPPPWFNSGCRILLVADQDHINFRGAIEKIMADFDGFINMGQ